MREYHTHQLNKIISSSTNYGNSEELYNTNNYCQETTWFSFGSGSALKWRLDEYRQPL